MKGPDISKGAWKKGRGGKFPVSERYRDAAV